MCCAIQRLQIQGRLEKFKSVRLWQAPPKLFGTRFEPSGCLGQLEGTMADDKTKVGQQDRDRINVNEDYELSDWEKHFGVSRERLREAVNAAGPMVKDVDKWLKSHHGK